MILFLPFIAISPQSSSVGGQVRSLWEGTARWIRRGGSGERVLLTTLLKDRQRTSVWNTSVRFM